MDYYSIKSKEIDTNQGEQQNRQKNKKGKASRKEAY
jgi:hypothetical protein